MLPGWAPTGLSILALVAGACAPQRTLPEETFGPIRIGVVLSLTGTLGTDGPGWADAARLAALELNAAGGPLPGRPVELLIEDDQTNSDNAHEIAQRFIDAGVVGIVGSAASSVSLGVAELATPARIPQISCCSTSDLITTFNENITSPQDRFFFRTAPPDGLQSVVVALAAQELACTRLAILHLNDSYGEPFGLAVQARYEARGGTVVARVPFADEQPSYTRELTMIRDAMPDCVALVAYPGSGGTIMRDWASLTGRPDVTWIGTDGVRAPGFVDEVGNNALIDGFFGTSPVTDPATPEYNDFEAHYRAAFGTTPIPFSSNQYDAMALLGLAIAHAGSTDGDAVRDALREVASVSARDIVRAGRLREALGRVRDGRDVDYQGASGNADFDDVGDVVTPFEIWRYDPPERPPCATATPLGAARGSFCRYRTINAEDIAP